MPEQTPTRPVTRTGGSPGHDNALVLVPPTAVDTASTFSVVSYLTTALTLPRPDAPGPGPQTDPAATAVNAAVPLSPMDQLRKTCANCLKSMESGINAMPGFLGRLLAPVADFLGNLADRIFPEEADPEDGNRPRPVNTPLQPEPPLVDPFAVIADVGNNNGRRRPNPLTLQSFGGDGNPVWNDVLEGRQKTPGEAHTEEVVRARVNISPDRLDAEDISKLRHILVTNGVHSPLLTQLERVLSERSGDDRRSTTA